MKKFVIGFLALIGGLTVVALVVVAGASMLSWIAKARVPGTTILEIDFEPGLVEHRISDPLEKLLAEPVPSVRDVVEALERAADDDRVVGVVARVGAGPISFAQIQEVRDAVRAFRDSGKPAVVHAETLGEFGPGNGGYYLATAFDEIYLQPSGDVGLTGFVYEGMFLKGTFEKLGIVPRVDHRHEYKNAMNSFTEEKFTEPHREALEALMLSRFDQMLEGVAEGRGIPVGQVRELIDNGPYMGQEAVDANLVDGLAYRDEVYDKVKQAAGEDAKLLYLEKYLQRAGRPHTSGDTIALIYGVGTVIRGSSGYDAFSGEMFVGSDTVTAAFRDAIEDDRVKAILFRIDSPGGSYVASDTILREVTRASEAGKPVVVSMGNLAASGGYFVAMSADRIVAQPSTVTGSIGVYAGKMLTTEMWKKIGVTWDEVHTSRNAEIWSAHRDYDETEYARFQAGLDRVYEDFTSKVARYRALDTDHVARIARGRIWTGEDALELGLVDQLGGFPAALEAAKELAGIDPEDGVKLKLLPREISAWESLVGEKPDSSEGRALDSLRRTVRAVRPLVRVLREAGGVSPEGVLRMQHPEPVDGIR